MCYWRVSLYIHITDTATNDIGEIVKDTLENRNSSLIGNSSLIELEFFSEYCLSTTNHSTLCEYNHSEESRYADMGIQTN